MTRNEDGGGGEGGGGDPFQEKEADQGPITQERMEELMQKLSKDITDAIELIGSPGAASGLAAAVPGQTLAQYMGAK